MPITRKLFQPLLRVILTHPLVVLAIFLMLAGALGWQARTFKIDASADTLLMRDDPDYIRTRIINRRFSPQEFLLIAYKPKNHPLFSEQTFKEIDSLSLKLRRLKRVVAVRSILNVPLFELAEGGITSIKEPSTLTIEHNNYPLAQLKETFRGHPLYEDLLINKEQSATAIQVLFKSDKELEALQERIIDLQSVQLRHQLNADQEKELARLKKQAEPIEQKLDAARAQEIEAINDILVSHREEGEFYLGGLHVLGYYLIRIIKNDLLVFGGAIALTICLVLFLLFNRIRWVVIPVVCCVCSVLPTMGLFGLLGLKSTVISSNFIVLQLILTLAIVLHLIVQYREYLAKQPEWSQQELVRQTLLRKTAPCFYAGITTSVGFASLLFSGIQPVISFGLMMIIAMIFSIVASLLLFPALLMLFGRERDARPWRFSRWLLKASAALTLRHGALITVSAVLVFVLSVYGLFLLDVENSFINYFRQRTRVHRELTFIDQQLGGSTPLDIVYTIPEAQRKNDLIMTANTVQSMQRIQYVLGQHKGMGKILSVVNFTELAKKINNNKPLTEYELSAIYWTMEDSLRDDLLGAYFSPEDAQVRFSVRIQDSTKGLDRAELLAGIRRDLQSLDIPENRYSLSNLFVLYQNILQQLFRSQILTIGIVYAVLTLTFLLIFRSLKIALIGIAPNILTTLVVLGLMGWLGITLDLMTITIAAIAMGIAVDDTIHYIHRYLEELSVAPPDKAVEQSHGSVGFAMLYTSVIIILGFSLLAFSDFVPSVLFGLLTGFAMAMALAFALCLLPVLLRKFIPQGA
jgi:hypothetical protein